MWRGRNGKERKAKTLETKRSILPLIGCIREKRKVFFLLEQIKKREKTVSIFFPTVPFELMISFIWLKFYKLKLHHKHKGLLRIKQR